MEKQQKQSKIKKICRQHAPMFRNIVLLVLPFFVIDLFMRWNAEKIQYFRTEMVIPNLLFQAAWIGLFIGITCNLGKKAAKICYGMISGLFFVLFLVHSIYYSLTGYFFGFHLLFMAGEGSAYILDTIVNTSPLIWLMCLVLLPLIFLAIKNIPQRERMNKKGILAVLAVFLTLHAVTPLFLGKANTDLEWDTWRNPRNVYQNFNDSNKNMKICGIYEYTFRDFCKTFLEKKEKADETELAYLDEAYKELSESKPNDYTGIFEGKNVIFLQLEGIDDWLLNATDMPVTYSLLSESMVFNKHYSYYNGGGSTFNSEFAVNTGMITPVSYTQNAYALHNNAFPNTLANLFKERGYAVNAFHMNTKEYYARGMNYDNWGYDQYYGLLDMEKYEDLSYELDRELIENESFYDKLFHQEGPFLHYLITYTPHTPFTISKGMGKLLAEKNGLNVDADSLSEEECAKLFAAETDYMVELLLKGLEENNLLENTVIVAFADHYLYTLNDKTILEQYKIMENHLINHTPFFIWQKDMESVSVDKVNSQLDILPTALNLFGITYIPEYYIGRDIFDEDYTGYVFFNDYSWYDGTVYVEDGVITNGGKMEAEKLETMNTDINELIRKNDLTLKYDYHSKKDT